MKHKFQILLIILTVALSFTACDKDDDISKEDTIQVSGIEFIPNFYINNEEIVGIDADVAAEAMKNAGIDIKLNMADSWKTAYDAILSGPNKALLTVAYTPERKDLFKWAGPTSQGMYGIFDNGHAGHIFPLPIEECKQLSPIAVVSNWLETTTLETLGFTNLTYYDSFDEALEAFMNGEIQYIASDFYHFTSSLPQGYFLTNINAVTRYRTVYYYIAFSKDVSDAVINKVQIEIENLIKDKSTVTILKNYLPLMPSDYIPGTIQLFTEFSPPSSYGAGHDTTRTVEGSSADIVNEIQARTGYTNKINLTLWNDAYDIVQYLPNSAVFATGRTPEREDLFQWIGPISSNKFHFYTLSSSKLAIETLEQAKTLQSVATPNGWISHDYLTDNNFQNIVATSLTTSETFNQLINEEVQAIFLPELDATWLADVNKIPMSDITEHLEAWTIDGYIAFSLSTPTSTVQQWQNHLDAMKTDGTFQTIWEKWYSDIEMP